MFFRTVYAVALQPFNQIVNKIPKPKGSTLINKDVLNKPGVFSGLRDTKMPNFKGAHW